MHVLQRIPRLLLALAVLGFTGCGIGLATGAAVVYYKSKGDHATVELKAKPDAVYQAAIASAERYPTLTIVKRNDAERELEISKDQETITFKVTALSADVSQLTVSSGKADEGESGSDLAIQAVKRVCNELKVEYKVVEE